ncbi:E3 ubiquitin-protein ligase TRIM33-like [Littorina saxatilis]|uniref:E3 ubiquitin-protein ligase TRIM33-like n=1 Tax=Littorina saxatilis TaxID=31220 RepID=UPI0038B60888
MAAAAPPSDEECPVCHDDFTDPKILPCTHLVCRKCVMSWLRKGGNQAGCPLCRASILPQGASIQDVAALVDDLPTDIITKAAVESRRVLNEKHVCVCDGTTKATSLCMQCRITFCPGCVKAHKMIPATREHDIKQIAALTVDKLAASYQSSCAVHPGRQVEQFCSSHQELICLNCSTSTHRRCPDVEGIAGAAMVKRQRLKEQEKELESKRGEIQTQVCQLDIAAADGLAKFKAMKDKVKTTFDELRNILDKRCRDATADIQKKEDEFLKENKSQKSDLEKQQARSAALCSTVSRLASASDDPLLAMLVKLKSRLEEAELLCMLNDDVRQKGSAAGIGDFFFDPQSSTRLKILIAEYGQTRDPKQLQSTSSFDAVAWRGAHITFPGTSVTTMVEEEIERKSQEVTETNSKLEPYKLRLLLAMGFQIEAGKRHERLKLEINVKKNCIVFHGLLKDVKESQVEMYEMLQAVTHDKITDMSDMQKKLLDSKETKPFIVQKFKADKIAAVWEIRPKGEVYVHAFNDPNLVKAIHIIKKSVPEHVCQLNPESAQLLISQDWKSLVNRQISAHPGLLLIAPSHDNQQVFIACTDNIMHGVVEDIEMFLRENTIYSQGPYAYGGSSRQLPKF